MHNVQQEPQHHQEVPTCKPHNNEPISITHVRRENVNEKSSEHAKNVEIDNARRIGT
jgi:hypothetical protein